jgi:hypothetical protein
MMIKRWDFAFSSTVTFGHLASDVVKPDAPHLFLLEICQNPTNGYTGQVGNLAQTN